MPENVSVLMDGELGPQEAQRVLADIGKNEELRARWATFHQIRDAMRDRFQVSEDFSRRVFERLEQEPTVLAPRPHVAGRVGRIVLPLSAAAAAAMVGWLVLNTGLPGGLVEQAADSAAKPAAQTVAVAESRPQAESPAGNFAQPNPAVEVQYVSVPVSPRLQDYLIVHQEYSPSSTMQGLAPYIRTVPATQPDAKR